jgi:hypothetical protein
MRQKRPPISYQRYTPHIAFIDKVDSIQDSIQEYKKKAIETEEARVKELDIHNLQPKKPDFDLKRDLDKKASDNTVWANSLIVGKAR